jgi:hypothetical protein
MIELEVIDEFAKLECACELRYILGISSKASRPVVDPESESKSSSGPR